MSGSYCGIRLGFYLLVGLGAVLFVVTQVMAAGHASPGLNLEDCDWFRQADQQVIETSTQTLDKHLGDTSRLIGVGGGGAPTDRSTGERTTGDDANGWEMLVASGKCPARNSS